MATRFYTTSENARLLTKAAKKNGFFFRTLMRTDTDTLVHCETNAQGYQYIKDNGIDVDTEVKTNPAGMTYRYKVQDRESGKVIGFYYTEDEANADVVLFGNNDKEHGTYTTDFYEIKPLDVEEETRYRLGALVKHLRFIQGLTQTQLAEKCGMAQPNIARIEAGTYATSIDVLSRIAEALGKRIELV
jgi:DNA-binding XRE family transcriptional regulator